VCHAEGSIDQKLKREFRDYVLRLQAAFEMTYAAADLPIPFFHIYSRWLLSALY
jgi:hypothetical protein